MRKLMNKIDRFCYTHPRFGIPNLMLIIVIGNAAVWLLAQMDTTGQIVSLLSGSAQGVEESAFLAGLAAELDYYRLKAHDMTGLDARIHPSEEKPRAIARDGEALVLQTDKGEHRYDGIFIFRAAMPLSMLLADLRTEGSYIPVDRGMRTNIPGVFAAGDCTGKPLQVPKAVGEGNIAAISAAEYIAKRG